MLTVFSNSILQLKVCNTDTGCFPDMNYKLLNGQNRSNSTDGMSSVAKAILNDGMLMYVQVVSPKCTASTATNPDGGNICGLINVDINGFKNPNQIGKDMFSFYLTKDAIIPQGLDGDLGSSFETRCSLKTKANSNGFGCTAWVIANENMDYLHCDNLSWTGKHKCK